MFDENKLREEIARVWGQYGAHMEVYDMLLQRAQVKHELIASANREHEDVDVTEVAKRLADLYNIEYVNLYTREEVYLVAERSVHAVINNMLTDNETSN